MNKFAFDLDGVFIPDCDHMPQIGSVSEFYALAHHMRPMFKPEGEWNIITGRSAKYRPQTMAWIDNHFENKPKRVWHELVDVLPAEYKADTINQNGIECFVESDIEQVKYLQQHVTNGCKIVHFSEYIKQNFLMRV